MIIIKTKQFTLRPMQLTDAPSYACQASNKKISHNMLRMPYPVTLRYVKQRIRRALLEQKKRRPGFFNLAIIIDNEFSGWISINNIEYGHKATIGYWLAQKHWNKGLMTQIVKKMTSYGFKRFKLQRIEATVFLHNPASARVLVKAGYKEEGILKKYYQKGHKYLDVHLLAKIK